MGHVVKILIFGGHQLDLLIYCIVKLKKGRIFNSKFNSLFLTRQRFFTKINDRCPKKVVLETIPLRERSHNLVIVEVHLYDCIAERCQVNPHGLIVDKFHVSLCYWFQASNHQSEQGKRMRSFYPFHEWMRSLFSSEPGGNGIEILMHARSTCLIGGIDIIG